MQLLRENLPATALVEVEYAVSTTKYYFQILICVLTYEHLPDVIACQTKLLTNSARGCSIFIVVNVKRIKTKLKPTTLLSFSLANGVFCNSRSISSWIRRDARYGRYALYRKRRRGRILRGIVEHARGRRVSIRSLDKQRSNIDWRNDVCL